MPGFPSRFVLVFAVFPLGCAASPAAPSAPSPPGRSAILLRTRPASTHAASGISASERNALHAAIVASLTPSAPGLDASETESGALEPIEPLVRDETPDPSSASEDTDPNAGRLPPESIRRVIHQSAGRFRDCYRRALLKNPARAGRVVVHFVIGADGRVMRSEEQTTSLGDRDARRCVLQAFFDLSFPNPARQTIAVEYPLSFTPDGSVPPDVMPSARKVADPPPPGFAEAMRSGRRAVPPEPVVPPPAPRLNGKPSSHCPPGDPLCPEL